MVSRSSFCLLLAVTVVALQFETNDALAVKKRESSSDELHHESNDDPRLYPSDDDKRKRGGESDLDAFKRSLKRFSLAKRLEIYHLGDSDDEFGPVADYDNVSDDEEDESNESGPGYENEDEKRRRKRLGALKKRQLSRTLALMRKRGMFRRALDKRHRHNF